ncbi:DNA-directed RNA polymerase subunit alpha [endosymbiont 'TC1' of Trimyema compressum]|uniref:DNA-directed RNA polymerase subunit alpha n=1 Tax=endosymbiont 'TC1' of Trimyema compressum TaxID=243899 RepID=UPI0007F130E4|nr:DNA-directed RNA polymerase subunit alpha [endosymbiont 'TC1' of Trimyema compressum]AMP20347.1 DNA-directed RNA polymerase subunit alpha [endosymbiont 'TC1' of Trimyema compressum]
MLEIEKPKISIIETSEDGSYGKIAIEPLEQGFGITLGNALRRTLLSSLPGIAVTSMQIEGVQHEFSTIPGVVEDTTDLLLAMKSLKLKSQSKEPKVLRIEKEGAGTVTARDIICDSDIEILNPDLHIATLEKEGRLFMEINIKVGRGYVGADDNKGEDAAIGEIPIDSLFSPVVKVNYEVKDKRVGKEADHDLLILEVWTNGSLTPEEAISGAARLIFNHITLFVALSDSDIAGVPLVEKEAEKKDQLLEKSIEDLDLSVRPYNCLKRADINTVGDLVNHTELEIMRVRNLGKKSLDEIHEKVAELELSFRNEDED